MAEMNGVAMLRNSGTDPSTPGARAAAVVSVEQLWCVYGRAGASAFLGAGGPAAGRARNPGGHADEPGAVRAVDGAAAAGGDGSGGAQGVAARLVLRQPELPAGDVAEDGGQAWGPSLRDHHSGELHRASAEAKAERVIAEELQRQGWQEADLLARPKNDAVKLEIAARLRRETTLSTKAIAARVRLGSSKAANRSLHSYMRGGAIASAGQGQLGI